MENLELIIFDTLFTLLLFSFASTLLITIGGWIYNLYCKLAWNTWPTFSSHFFGQCFSILFCIGCFLGLFCQGCYIGFKNNQPIDNMPPFILQIHCHCPYNAEHNEYIMSIQEAMDYCH